MTGGIELVKSKINEIKNNPAATQKEQDLFTTLEACYEFYSRGFEFAPIDVFKSDATKFVITEDGRLLPPFVALSGLGGICRPGHCGAPGGLRVCLNRGVFRGVSQGLRRLTLTS